MPLLEILTHIAKHRLPSLLFIFALAYAAHLWLFVSGVIALKWILIGRERASRYRIHSFAHMRSLVFAMLQYAFYLRHVMSFPGTSTLRLVWRLMGARIGHRVVVANCPDGLDHPDLISIGNDAHIGDLSMLRAGNVAPDGTVEVGHIQLGHRYT